MKALATKINSYGTGVNIVNNYDLNRRILNIMLGAIAMLALLYAVFLVNTVYNIVERQSLSRDERSLSNDVGDMELAYLSMSNKIDVNMATSLGFKESKKQYATRKSFSSLDSIKLAKDEI